MSLFNNAPKDYRTLFLDMDAFFASCEQQMRPELRGRPIGIVPTLVSTTCVLTASYEAKRVGVKTAMPIWEAKKRCPDILLVEARPPLYKKIHFQIVDILNTVSPWVFAKSIDEFAVILSPREQNEQIARDISQTIKERLRATLGEYITASIGFAPNQFLAKVAGAMNKPNGLKMITLATLESTLATLELTDLPGIARGMSRRLRAENIYTIEQLLMTEPKKLRRMFGWPGEVWWYRLHGYEVDNITHNRASIGHSHVLAPDWRMPNKAYQVLTRLVHKAGQRLRHEGFLATYTSLLVRYLHDDGYYNFVRTHPYYDSPTAMQMADQLFAGRPRHLEPILHLAFTFSGLQPAKPRPQSLFPEVEKPVLLTEALDVINDKYGRDTIFAGSMLKSQTEAPDRIPFGEVRY